MNEAAAAERWRRIATLFDEVLSLPPHRRAELLARRAGDDAGLLQEVQAMLDQAETQGDVFDRPASESVLREVPLASLAQGTRVGAWRIEELVGRGGMGEVYRAERIDAAFQQQVALKLIRREAVDQLDRFHEERRVLARLDHPGIARLIDGGLADDGRPYMAMEWVEGVCLTDWCVDHKARLGRRLDLFLQVCESVAYAHRNLLVHRDLKPGNVLVTAEGRVKLLDFGVAKLLTNSGDETKTHAPLTLAYAAPEQLTQGPITPATDVYALGLILFELLTGQRPWHRPQMSLPMLLDKQLRETAPAPSATASKLAAAPVPSKQLRGDLDAITRYALRAEPERRYRSAAELADDLRRYLDGRPVLARPESLGYSFNRFVRRNRLATAFAGIAIIALIAGLAVAVWQGREAARQRDETWTQLGRATAANDFMEFLLSVAAPAGQKFSVGELLEQGESLIDKQFAGNDALRAEMLVRIGQHYLVSESFDKALPLMARATEIAERSNDPAVQARALCTLAFLKILNGEQQAAEAMMAEAFTKLPEEPHYDLLRAECLIRSSEFGLSTGDAERTMRDASAAIQVLEKTPVTTGLRSIDAQAALAYGYYLARENQKANETYAQVTVALEQAGRERTRTAAAILNNWALVHYLGEISKAEPLCRRGIELLRSIEGANSVTPTAMYFHAGVLLQLARYDEAERLFEETIRTAAARGELRTQLDAMMELAELHIRTGDLPRASAQLSKLAPYTQPGKIMPRAQYAYYQGHLAEVQGNQALARDRFAEAVERYEKSKQKIALNVFALIGLARTEEALGQHAAALAAAGRAISLAESFVEKGRPSYLIGLSQMALGDIQLAIGQTDAARIAFGTSLEHLQQTLGSDHPSTRDAEARQHKGGLAVSSRNPPSAESAGYGARSRA